MGVLAVLVVGLDGHEILARIQAANGLLVVCGVLGLTAVHALGGAAWRLLCRQLGGLRLPWTTTLRVYYAAQALGGITPANIGGDAYRVLAVRRAGLGWSAAVAPVLVQRATSYLALALLALAGLGRLAASSLLPAGILAVGLLLSVLAGGAAVLLLLAPGPVAALRARLQRNSAADRREGSTDTANPVRPPLGSVLAATLLALGFHGLSILLTALLVAAVDPSAIGIPIVAAITVARLSVAVPILPSGIGANEAILSLLFAALGLAPQIALAALLLTRVALLLTTLLGGLSLLVGRPRIPSVAHGPDQLPAATTR